MDGILDLASAAGRRLKQDWDDGKKTLVDGAKALVHAAEDAPRALVDAERRALDAAGELADKVAAQPAALPARIAVAEGKKAMAVVRDHYAGGGVNRLAADAHAAVITGELGASDAFHPLTVPVHEAVATRDAALAGDAHGVVEFPISIDELESDFRGLFRSVASKDDIATQMKRAGEGARAIVYGRAEGADPTAPGHTFNVANRRGFVLFVDGYSGTEASFVRLNQLELLWTKGGPR